MEALISHYLQNMGIVPRRQLSYSSEFFMDSYEVLIIRDLFRNFPRAGLFTRVSS